MLKMQLQSARILPVLAQKNKSQRWLAKKLGISSGYMAQLLNGTRCPSPKTREKIQEHFKDWAFDELFTGIEEHP